MCVLNRTEDISIERSSLFVSCNAHCQCSETEWDPVCGENGLTYVSACLAGCRMSRGSRVDMVRKLGIHNHKQWAVFVGIKNKIMFVTFFGISSDTVTAESTLYYTTYFQKKYIIFLVYTEAKCCTFSYRLCSGNL